MATTGVDQYDVAKVLLRLIRELPKLGYSTSEVRFIDNEDEKQLSRRGLILTPMQETEGDSLAGCIDIGYRFKISRVGRKLSPHTGFESRDDWRRLIHRRFNRTKIGVPGELMTRCEFHTQKYKTDWDRDNIDKSALIIVVWVREEITGLD